MRSPLTPLTGPEFLAFFAVLIAAVVVFTWWWRKTHDPSVRLPPLVLPKGFDPYELAYLRAGVNELTRVLIVGLIEGKYLRITTPERKRWRPTVSYMEQNPEHPDVARLTPIERAGFAWFEIPRSAADVFKTSSTLASGSLPSTLQLHTLPYERKLQSEQLLTSEEFKDQARRNAFLGCAIILAVGLARLLIGISRGRPVGFLVVMGIVGLFLIWRVGVTRRLSRRGYAYLEETKAKLSWLREPTRGAGWSPALAAAAFGFVVLSGTELGPLNDMFRRSNADGGVAGGGACGGGCGGGGGGGGCGG